MTWDNGTKRSFAHEKWVMMIWNSMIDMPRTFVPAYLHHFIWWSLLTSTTRLKSQHITADSATFHIILFKISIPIISASWLHLTNSIILFRLTWLFINRHHCTMAQHLSLDWRKFPSQQHYHISDATMPIQIYCSILFSSVAICLISAVCCIFVPLDLMQKTLPLLSYTVKEHQIQFQESLLRDVGSNPSHLIVWICARYAFRIFLYCGKEVICLATIIHFSPKIQCEWFALLALMCVFFATIASSHSVTNLTETILN